MQYGQIAIAASEFALTLASSQRWAILIDLPPVNRRADMFHRLPCRVQPVTITGGESVTEADGYLQVPKRELVGAVQVLLQTGRLKIARELPEAALLTSELLNFQVKITETGHDSYGAWREGQHDDLVLALALAVWYPEHHAASRFLGFISYGSARGWNPARRMGLLG
jgi:hypothetical protein